LREKEGYDDDYIGSIVDEMGHEMEEAERITKLLKRQMPETEQLRQKELFDDHRDEIETMDAGFMDR